MKPATRAALMTIAVVAVLALPWLLPSPYHRHVLIMAVVFVIFAMGLNVILGYAGQLAFGYTAFFALGAYATSLMSIHVGGSFWLAIAVGAVFSGAVAYLLGYPCFRLRGPYFAIVTFAFAEIIRLVVNNWISVTNGPMGLTIDEAPNVGLGGLLPVHLKGELSYYYFMLLLLALSAYATHRIIFSRFGRALIGIREDEELAVSIGIDAFGFKMRAWVISAMLAGLAGGAYAGYFRVVDPLLFALYYTFLVWAMVLIGGGGTFLGPIIGGILFTVLPESLRMAESFRMILFTSALLLTVLFAPQGIAGLVKSMSQRRRSPPPGRALEDAALGRKSH